MRSAKPPRATRASRRKIDVCVVWSSYEGSESPTASVDSDGETCSPAHWVQRHKNRYRFHHFPLTKAGSYSKVRELASSKKYDCFYNLCDGAKDESRAGAEVIKTFESFNQAYTGADYRGFEPSKTDMKMALGSTSVKYPNFVPLHRGDSVSKLCRHLRFPVIVKHISGYASVGITAKSKCNNMKQLREQCKKNIEAYNHALVEEFITGREGTVFVCADRNSSDGVKVFPPIMMDLGSGDEFAHFDNKWVTNNFTDENTKPKGLDPKDPAYGPIKEMAKAAFKLILHGVGYGRCDFRIDDRTGEPYFLEINPNCGMLYPPKTGGCYADVAVELDEDWDHDTFISTQIELAIDQRRAREPWVNITYNAQGQWTAQATRNIVTGTRLFPDSTKIIPVTAKALFDVNKVPKAKLGQPTPLYEGKVNCAIYRSDGIDDTIIPLAHSCEPNMAIENGPTVSVVARKPIKKGTFLTIDFSTLRDPAMPNFTCTCGSKNCAGVIKAQSVAVRQREPTNSTVGAKANEAAASAVAKDAELGSTASDGVKKGASTTASSSSKKAPASKSAGTKGRAPTPPTQSSSKKKLASVNDLD